VGEGQGTGVLAELAAAMTPRFPVNSLDGCIARVNSHRSGTALADFAMTNL
jgi:hypothetical protein